MGCSHSSKTVEQKSRTRGSAESDSKLLAANDFVDWKDVFASGINKDNYVNITADYVHSCLIAKNEPYVIELVCTADEDKLKDICVQYSLKYSRSLNDAITEVCCADVSDILCTMLQREESDLEQEDVEVTSSKMVDCIPENKLFENDGMFQHMLKKRNRLDIQAVLELFLRKCQRDICVEIEKKFPEGRTKAGYLIFAQLIRSPHLYHAEKIHNLMTSQDVTEQRNLAFIVLSQNEKEIQGIKSRYQSAHFEVLSTVIKDSVKNPFLRKSLLDMLTK